VPTQDPGLSILVVLSIGSSIFLFALLFAVVAKTLKNAPLQREIKNPFDCVIPEAISSSDGCLICVESFPAGAFICDNCGKYNFFSLVAVHETNMSDKDFQRLKFRLTSCSMDEDNLYLYPAQVQCEDCRTVYALKTPEDVALNADLPPNSE